MRRPSMLTACVVGVLMLSSCADTATSGAPPAATEETAAARVPLLRDALTESMTTLGHVPEGDGFFSSADPRPAVRSGFVMPHTLEEAVADLRDACSPSG